MNFSKMSEIDFLKSSYIEREDSEEEEEGNGEFSSFRDYEYERKCYKSPKSIINKERKFYEEHSDLKSIKVDEGTQEYLFFSPENKDITLHLEEAEPGTWDFEPDEVILIGRESQYKDLLTGEIYDNLIDANFPIKSSLIYKDGYYISKAHLKELTKRETEKRNEEIERAKRFGSTFASTYESSEFDAEM